MRASCCTCHCQPHNQSTPDGPCSPPAACWSLHTCWPFHLTLLPALLAASLPCSPLAQFDIETGISLRDTEAGLAAFILFLFFAAINPGSGKFVFVNDESLNAKN